MDGKLNIFQAISRKMSWLGQRQSVLAENIANADTPDYTPQDMKSGPFASMLARSVKPVTTAATHPAHMTGAPANDRPAESEEQRRRYETAPSGNSVVIEEQLVKVAETQMDYQLMSNLYRKHLGMIRTALGRGG